MEIGTEARTMGEKTTDCPSGGVYSIIHLCTGKRIKVMKYYVSNIYIIISFLQDANYDSSSFLYFTFGCVFNLKSKIATKVFC